MWAASPIMIDMGQDAADCTTNEINPIRSFAFLFVTLAIALIYHRGLPPLLTSPRVLFQLAANVFLSYMVGDILYFIAIKKIGLSLAVPIGNSYPMLTVLTSWAMLGETISLQTFFGIVVVVSGLISLKLGDKSVTDDSELMEGPVAPGRSRLMKGFMMALTAGLAWAVGAPLNKMAIVESGLGAVDITLYRAILFFILVWANRFLVIKYAPDAAIPLKKVPLKGWAYFSIAASIGLGIASIIYSACITIMPVAIVTAITATSPFMSALFGHFALNDRLYPVQWAGVIMIIAGSITVSI